MDPAFLRTRKEAVIILAAFAVCMASTIVLSWILGYSDGPLTTIWGIPSWILFGVMVPWAAATAFSVWFSLAYMRDE